jgi:peroxiredoxin
VTRCFSPSSAADQGASIVMVYPGPSRSLKKYASEFVGGQSFPANVTLLVDPDYAFTNAYGLRWEAPNETAYPTTLVIDKSGTIRYALVSRSHGGRSKSAAVLKEVEALK